MNVEHDHDPALLVQDVVYAGLDALRAVAPLELAAYLHETPRQGPQLFLGTPTLATIEPTDAFNLFSALRDALAGDHDGDELTVAGYRVVAVTTRSRASRGLHVFGRRDGELPEHQRAAATQLARTFGEVVGRIEALPPVSGAPATARADAVPSPIRVAVEMIEGRAHAEVAVAAGHEVRTGTADAPTGARAVALAAVDAMDASLKVLDAGEGDIAGARAVLALVADGRGRQALGAALVDEQNDALRATATAALDASARLLGAGADDDAR